MDMVRKPAVAGQFYTDKKDALRSELAVLIKPAADRKRVLGVIAPHAGYLYSGAVAGELYGAIEVPPTVVILGPNHHGIGARAALSPASHWLTPLGAVPINASLAERMAKHDPALEFDARAHVAEHSLEVQLPFLQTVRPDLSIVPICLAFSDYPSCHSLGSALAKALIEHGDPVLIVASSDMTHYESAATAKEKDEKAMKEVLDLDPEGLLALCRSERISMCGVVPATVMLVAVKALGATTARLILYATSGDITGDNRRVVGYAGVTVF